MASKHLNSLLATLYLAFGVLAHFVVLLRSPFGEDGRLKLRIGEDSDVIIGAKSIRRSGEEQPPNDALCGSLLTRSNIYIYPRR